MLVVKLVHRWGAMLKRGLRSTDRGGVRPGRARQLDDQRGVDERYAWVIEPRVLEVLRRIFRQSNRAMVLMWRLGLGRLANAWPRGFGRLMVIEHVGRRSGSRYRTPVNYTVVGDDLYCVAAFGERTDWYRNIIARPDIAVWLPDGRWEATVEDVSDEPQRLELMRQILIDSGFAAPLFGLHPRLVGDEDLAAATSTYRLLRIVLLRHRAAAQGPGDLAWTWLPIGMALMAGLLWWSRHVRHLVGTR